MTPLSKEEIKEIKQLDYKEYVSIPLIYGEEISKVFFEILPKLIKIAEAYEEQSLKPKDISLEKMKKLKFLLDNEKHLIQSLESDIKVLKKFYGDKQDILESVEPEPMPVPEPVIVPDPVVVPKVSWFKRILGRK